MMDHRTQVARNWATAALINLAALLMWWLIMG
jgi:hypothetical protein